MICSDGNIASVSRRNRLPDIPGNLISIRTTSGRLGGIAFKASSADATRDASDVDADQEYPLFADATCDRPQQQQQIYSLKFKMPASRGNVLFSPEIQPTLPSPCINIVVPFPSEVSILQRPRRLKAQFHVRQSVAITSSDLPHQNPLPLSVMEIVKISRLERDLKGHFVARACLMILLIASLTARITLWRNWLATCISDGSSGTRNLQINFACSQADESSGKDSFPSGRDCRSRIDCPNRFVKRRNCVPRHL